MAVTNSWAILWFGVLIGSLVASGLTVVFTTSYKKQGLAALFAVSLTSLVFGLICLLGGLF